MGNVTFENIEGTLNKLKMYDIAVFVDGVRVGVIKPMTHCQNYCRAFFADKEGAAFMISHKTKTTDQMKTFIVDRIDDIISLT